MTTKMNQLWAGVAVAAAVVASTIMFGDRADGQATRAVGPERVEMAEELVEHFIFRQRLVNFFTLADQRIAAYVEAGSAAGLDVAESTVMLLTARDRSQESLDYLENLDDDQITIVQQSLAGMEPHIRVLEQYLAGMSRGPVPAPLNDLESASGLSDFCPQPPAPAFFPYPAGPVGEYDCKAVQIILNQIAEILPCVEIITCAIKAVAVAAAVVNDLICTDHYDRLNTLNTLCLLDNVEDRVEATEVKVCDIQEKVVVLQSTVDLLVDMVEDLRLANCDIIRLLHTPSGQRVSDLSVCDDHPEFPYGWPEN